MGKLARLKLLVSTCLRKFARSIAATVPVLARDLIGIGGAGLIAYGVWLIYQPYGFISAGVMLLIGAFLNAKAQ
jgi:hypothetical protein